MVFFLLKENQQSIFSLFSTSKLFITESPAGIINSPKVPKMHGHVCSPNKNNKIIIKSLQDIQRKHRLSASCNSVNPTRSTAAVAAEPRSRFPGNIEFAIDTDTQSPLHISTVSEPVRSIHSFYKERKGQKANTPFSQSVPGTWKSCTTHPTEPPVLG